MDACQPGVRVNCQFLNFIVKACLAEVAEERVVVSSTRLLVRQAAHAERSTRAG
jgi:hypothetical protein